MVEDNANLEPSSPVPQINLESSSSFTGDKNLKSESQSKAVEDSKLEDSSNELTPNQNASLPMDHTGTFEEKTKETIVVSSQVQEISPDDTSSGVRMVEGDIQDAPQSDEPSEPLGGDAVVPNEASGSISRDIHNVPQSDEPSEPLGEDAILTNEALGSTSPESHIVPQSAEPSEPLVEDVTIPSEASGRISSKHEREVDVKAVIDTSAPIESVKEAVFKFGGITDWKTHKVQSQQKRMVVELQLQKIYKEIPEYKKQTEAAEDVKSQVLNELDRTKRLIEELKLNLERAQTEENQAKQDSELAKLRVEEVEQGIADESSVVAKAQIEVAHARHVAAVEELKSVKDELEKLRAKYSSLTVEKELAVKRAEDTVSTSNKVEKTVNELTLELIVTKETLESAHAAHMEAEDRFLKAAEANEADSLTWEKELKQAEEELQELNHQLLLQKDLESRLETRSTILHNLQAKVSTYTEEKSDQECSEEGDNLKAKNENELQLQEAVETAKKGFEEVRIDIEKATAEVNCLKVASESLKSRIEREKLEVDTTKQKEQKTLMEVASLEVDLNNTRLETAVVQMKENEARGKIVDVPRSPLQQSAEEAEQAKSLVLLAREELRKAKEEAQLAKASVSTIKSRLLATQKEIEASRASERLALAAAKALEESELHGNTGELEGVTLPIEEYDALSKNAREAEQQAYMRVAAASSQIEAAKESELKSLEKLEELNKEMVAKKKQLTNATEKAEKAKDEQLGIEQELRKWRDENMQRQIANDVGGGPSKSFKERELKSSDSDGTPLSQSGTNSKVSTPENSTDNNSSPNGRQSRKNKKSIFPRIILYFARRKSLSPKVV